MRLSISVQCMMRVYDVRVVQVLSQLYTRDWLKERLSDLIQRLLLLMGNLICASCRACPEIKVNFLPVASLLMFQLSWAR